VSAVKHIVFVNGEPAETDEAPHFLPMPVAPEPTYREKRAVAYRDELGKEPGDFIKTIGDVVDVLIAEIDALRAAKPETPAFAELLPKVRAIKERFPAPAAAAAVVRDDPKP
jgi:hypothetical protein